MNRFCLLASITVIHCFCLVAEDNTKDETKSKVLQNITVPFQGDSLNSITDYLVKQNLGDAKDPGILVLAETLAETAKQNAGNIEIPANRFEKGTASLKTYQDEIAKLIAIRAPEAWINGLKQYLARFLIHDLITTELSLSERVKSLVSMANLAEANQEALVNMLSKTWPQYADAKPAEQKAIWDAIDALNPGLLAAGWQRIETSTATEPWPHLDLKNSGHLLRYRYQALGGPLLIPDKVALKKIAASASPLGPEFFVHAAPKRWSALLELPKALPGNPPQDLRLSLAGDDSGVVSAVIIIPSQSNKIILTNLVDQAEADPGLLPTLGQYTDQPVWPKTLVRNKDTLSGSIVFSPSESAKAKDLRLHLDVVLQGNKAQGTFTVRNADAGTGGLSGKVSGDSPRPAADPLKGDASWMTMGGNTGSGSAGDTAPAMIDDMKQAKIAWISDDLLPHAEGSDIRSVRKPGETVMGGFASPALANNRVFLSYYRPSGNVPFGFHAKREETQRGAMFAILIQADDVVTAMDAQTGATLWKTIFPLKSANRGGMHKTGFQGSPCAVGDSVYVMGNLLKMYCLDAATGLPRWESDLGPGHRRISEEFRQNLAQKALIGGSGKSAASEWCNRGLQGNPRMIDGVLVVHDGQRWNAGLVGIDPATGKRLWHRSYVASSPVPLVWRHQDREYVIGIGNGATALDPRDGRILWHIDGLDSGYIGASTICGDTLFAFNSEKKCRAGFTLSLTGCTKAWELPDELSTVAQGPASSHRGRIYTVNKETDFLLVLDPLAGKVLAKTPQAKGAGIEHGSLIIGAGDRLWSDNGRELMGLFGYAVDQVEPRPLGLLSAPRTAGYAVPLHSALADGRMFMRLKDRMVCFDLRK